MAKAKTQFICQNCGTVHSRWVGKCDGCGQWNTIVEEDPMGGIGSGPGKMPKKGRPVALTTLSGEIEEAPRIPTGLAELDRATGGGFVRGSAVLIGGDPGIGKSTLLMQAAAALSRNGHRVVYVSGEEAVAQVRLRAQRLNAADTDVLLAAETNVEDILATISEGKRPDLVIIDSIQTLWSDTADSAPGTVTQVRTGVQAMIRFAKQTGATMVLVGHVTKEGQIAGPRVVEHMVDAVLYFEGDRGHHYRILRTVKNRFGPTDEIGVFEMSDKGLREVANPSELFLGERNEKAPGAAVFAGMEGTRPVLVEVQALVAATALGTPRRAVVGWDSSRLAMILAVLEAHCGVRLGQHDVYLNVAGGYRITEPAADMAIASALVSSLAGVALPADCVYFGEISLSGAVRPVSHTAQRLKEAEKLGFSSAVLPTASPDLPKGNRKWGEIDSLPDLVARIAGSKLKSSQQAVED
ncbi:DNA repair protein RadA [Allorhizobium taibaishanense]|uniref:DNA repair protein RadA n=1 Tax=Allorhizobium taibaishanense TaxID=887144 RepID=A0A1Q8ZZ37_9HYPH|nr:DNA repair protein RadA [Allorhizobium taibaishanense]MBB4007441.1 DNA repair protein RadA/Sms [Allorhizobium taibaishanense]OLP47602.1 DNA repair protein RadA [Allorhizobium taibaishanense]